MVNTNFLDVNIPFIDLNLDYFKAHLTFCVKFLRGDVCIKGCDVKFCSETGAFALQAVILTSTRPYRPLNVRKFFDKSVTFFVPWPIQIVKGELK